jgi:hypothetical protein
MKMLRRGWQARGWFIGGRSTAGRRHHDRLAPAAVTGWGPCCQPGTPRRKGKFEAVAVAVAIWVLWTQVLKFMPVLCAAKYAEMNSKKDMPSSAVYGHIFIKL